MTALGKTASRRVSRVLDWLKAGRQIQDSQRRAHTAPHRFFQEKSLVMFKRLPIIPTLTHPTPEMRMICNSPKIRGHSSRMTWAMTTEQKVFLCRGVEKTLRMVRLQP